jgi:HEAT repeat protein
VEAHQDQDERLRREIARALAGGRPKAAVGVPWLIEALDDEPVRHLAAKALGDMGPEAKDAVPALLKASRVDDDLTRFPVAEALWKITRDAPTAVALLTESLKDGVFLPTRMDAASLLAEIGPASQPAAPSLVGMLGCGNEEAARVAAHALSAIGKKAVPLVVASLSSSNPSQRQFALHALGRIGLQEPDALSAVISALRDDAWLVRLTAANTLGAAAVETQEIVSALRAATCDPHPFVRTAAAGALDVLAENRRP